MFIWMLYFFMNIGVAGVPSGRRPIEPLKVPHDAINLRAAV